MTVSLLSHIKWKLSLIGFSEDPLIDSFVGSLHGSCDPERLTVRTLCSLTAEPSSCLSLGSGPSSSSPLYNLNISQISLLRNSSLIKWDRLRWPSLPLPPSRVLPSIICLDVWYRLAQAFKPRNWKRLGQAERNPTVGKGQISIKIESTIHSTSTVHRQAPDGTWPWGVSSP